LVGLLNVSKDYKEKLSGISHLEEVDSIWKEVKEHTSQLTASEKRDEGLAIAIEKNKEEVDEKIADTVQTTNAAVESLSKRIKYAYLIAGGSAGLAIIELILLLMRVI
jgi:tetrahydromethanopterin S-methyltransferase subunit A